MSETTYILQTIFKLQRVVSQLEFEVPRDTITWIQTEAPQEEEEFQVPTFSLDVGLNAPSQWLPYIPKNPWHIVNCLTAYNNAFTQTLHT